MKKPCFTLTKKQYRDMKKENRLAVTFTLQGIILFSSTAKTIKGKLGFDINTPDEKFLFNSQAIYTAIKTDAKGYYAAGFLKLGLLFSQNDLFKKAIDAMRQGGLGMEGDKNAIKLQLFRTLLAALAFINDTSNDDQVNAVAIITGAKMIVVKEKTSEKQDFTVKQGGATEEVDLISLAVKIGSKYVPAIYMWQFSIDGGKTWEDLEPTSVAHTTATGMLIGISTLFRKRTKTTQYGMSKWSPPIEFFPQ